MPAKYQAYPTYKDSGLKWLGKVPEHWEVSKFGYVKTVLTDFTANGSFADLKKNVIYRDEQSYARLVRLTDLRKNLNNVNGVWIDEKAYNYLKKSALFGGEFLLANVGAYAGLFYQMPEIEGKASLAPNMFMAKFHAKKILREFMAYVGQSRSANEQLKLNATASSAQPKLNKDDFKSIRFSYPSIEEQKQIAKFLDHETAKMDTLIEKQQQLIKLLKEKRQAVISHAVTKGLNPNAPMKDSGVEWLGDVPAHWEMSKMRYMFSFDKGLTITKSDLLDEGVPCVNYGEVHSKYGFEVDPVKHPLKCVDSSYLKKGKGSLLSQGDLIFADTSEDIEGSGNFTQLISNQAIFAGYHTIIARPKNRECSRFYAYLMDSIEFRTQIRKAVKGVKVFSITQAILRNSNIWLPPTDEQKQIAAFLDQKTAQIDKLVSKAEQAIELIKERRTALISAAVTGKVDVRKKETTL